MSDRNRQPFPVSRTLQNAKNRFIAAKIYQILESVTLYQTLFQQHQRGYV